jgi:hypothetical protein
MVQSNFFKKFNKMIGSRKQKTANLDEINEYFTLSNRVINILEEYIGVQTTPIHATIAELEKDFLKAFHEKKLREVNALVETETWL